MTNMIFSAYLCEMDKSSLVRTLRIGLLFLLLFNYIFLFFGPTNWQDVYLSFSIVSDSLPQARLFVGWISLVSLFLFQIFNLKRKPWPAIDILIAILLWFIKSESLFAHCHWSEILPFVFILLALDDVLIKKKIDIDFFLGIRILVSLVYFSSLNQRLLDPTWQSGEFVSAFLNNPIFSKLAGSQFLSALPHESFSTYAILYVEFLGALLPFRKASRAIVILLLPIHLFLLLFSTESVWQVLFLVLLGIIYFEPPIRPVSATRFKKKIRAFKILFLVFIYTAALPYDIRLSFLLPAIAGTRSVFDQVGMQALYNQRLFHARPYRAFCPKILVQKNRPTKDLLPLYSVTPDDCLERGQGWIQDHFYHSILQYVLTIGSWNMKHSHYSETRNRTEKMDWINQAQVSLSDSLCNGKISTLGNDYNVLVFATLISGSEKPYRVRTQILSIFRCLNNHVEIIPTLDFEFNREIVKQESAINQILSNPWVQ